MALIPNEMLQDPAILMTSKNPSLSGPKWRPRYGAGNGGGSDFIANLLSPTEQAKKIDSTQTGRSNKSAKRTPKKRKPKTPSKQSQSVTSQVAQLTIDTPTSNQVDQENQSPAKKPRRDTRTFRPSHKNSSPKTPKQVTKGNTSRPLGNNTNLVQSVQQHLPQPKQTNTNTNTPFKRFPVQSNGFQQNRFVSSELNPHARSFIPRGFSKPGISNEYVSREIFEYYQRNRQTNERFKSKQILRQSLENTFKQAFPNHVINLHLVGSSTNGIGDNSSSADFCIIANKRSAPAVMPVPNNPEPVTTTSINATEPLEATNLQDLAESTSSETVSSEIQEITEAKEELKEIEKELELAQEVSEKLNLESEEENKPIDELEAITEADAVVIEEKNDNVSEDAGKIKEKENVQNEAEKVETVLNEQPVNSEIAVLTLDLIEKVLQNKNFAKNIVTIPAKVPIIKFKDDISKLDITLNLNQDVSIRNTQLIRDYAKMDWRFPYLAMILKQWARENRINSAIDKTISNYSWTLMVIHFLQVCDPPVLPSLQKLVPRRYDQHENIEQAVNNWRRYPAKWRSNNNSNLRQLLKSMFRYYGYVFSYDTHVISVREGKALERTAVYSPNPDDHHNQWNSFLCIEEPFTRSNTTRSVHDKDKFDRIIELFRMSSNALRGLRISLFNVIADDLEFPITY